MIPAFSRPRWFTASSPRYNLAWSTSDRQHHGDVGVDHVGGVPAAAHPDLDHGDVDRGVGERGVGHPQRSSTRRS